MAPRLWPCRTKKKKKSFMPHWVWWSCNKTTKHCSASFCSFIHCHGGHTTDLTGWRKHQEFSLQKQTSKKKFKIRYLIFFIFSNYLFRAFFYFGLETDHACNTMSFVLSVNDSLNMKVSKNFLPQKKLTCYNFRNLHFDNSLPEKLEVL